jgi:uncharacterized membrane protein
MNAFHKKIILLSLLIVGMPLLSGCWVLAAAGAGAYGGYYLKKEGYTLQGPIIKEKSSKKNKTNETNR